MSLPVFEFGDFRLDSGRFELLREGRGLRLERKPMELLLLLVEANGRLVTRAEIAQKLWDSEVFVDTEHGINTAIRKIRLILGDDPENPRFIQTVTGMGYRFVAPVKSAPAVPASEPPQLKASPEPIALPVNSLEPSAPPEDSASRSRFPLPLLLAVAGACAILVATFSLTLGPHPLAARLLAPQPSGHHLHRRPSPRKPLRRPFAGLLRRRHDR